MALKTFLIRPFDHRETTRQFEETARMLSPISKDRETLLIGNYDMNGTRLDAILITADLICILEYKHCGGNITVQDRGDWTADSRVISGGYMDRSPYLQARRDRSRVASALSRYVGRQLMKQIHACVVFSEDATIDNRLTPTAREWLSVCDQRSLTTVLSAMAGSAAVLTPEELRSLPDLLRIREFEVNPDNLPTHHDRIETSVADSATACYERLEQISRDENQLPREKYRRLRALFRQIVNQAVADNELYFDSIFSKLDYLLHEHNVPAKVARIINDSRTFLNSISNGTDHTDADLRANLPHDVKAVTYLVYHVNGHVPIPASLKTLFPVADRKVGWGRFSEKCLRCLVRSWDDEYLYVTSERNGEQLKACYGPRNPYLTHTKDEDWTYLKSLLTTGSTVNLVRLRFVEDVCMPEMIILSPDYLINITTITSCFETYAESPFVYMVNKLAPKESTSPMILGNLSGRFLDETVHQTELSFNDSVSRFVHQNALDFIGCEDLWDKTNRAQFTMDAKVQRRNVEHLVNEVFPRLVGPYDRKATILEPTFFSEILGLQGRMDFFSRNDKPIIIEQKSGKGDFVRFDDPDYDPKQPLPKLQHTVQLVLYRALCVYEYNFHASYLYNIFLLYSKYDEGLIKTGPRRDLLFRALKLRNQLARCEEMYAHGGLRLLEQMTPEKLNLKNTTGNLWINWTRPKLASILDPIHEASDLERAYYFRFLTFTEKEQLLSKVGNKEKEDSGFSSLWIDSLEDRKAAGNIYDGLTIHDFEPLGPGVEKIRLDFPEAQSADTSNFRKGDIVMLYPYPKGRGPQACRQMVIRCIIDDIQRDSVTVTLRNPQVDRRLFTMDKDSIWSMFYLDDPKGAAIWKEGVVWAIEHDQMDSSANALYSGLQRFLTAPKSRRDLILSQREPEVDETLTAKGTYKGEFTTLVQRSRQARELFLVIGPPGTGKTSFGLVNILKEQLLEEGTNVLLMSYTNRAVDEICKKLKENHIGFIRLGHEASCDKSYKDNFIANKLLGCRNIEQMTAVLRSTRVFCGTTTTLSNSMSLFRIKHFDLAIVDEASQILEPHLIGLLSAANGDDCAIDKFVLIGDHKQLPAVVQQSDAESRVTDPELRAIHLTNCRLSLFERLLEQFKRPDGSYDPRYVYMLTHQGRMHRDIAEFPNYAFYGNQLKVVPLPFQEASQVAAESDNGIDQLLTRRRIVFAASERPVNPPSPKTNPVEAEMIAATVVRIYHLVGDQFRKEETVGVIVPYRNQIATVRNALDRYGIKPLHDITIDTVERYQGSQRDYIVYGFTVQEPYQLNFLANNTFEEDGLVVDRKLNVAMTRARLHLLIIGNPDILSGNFTFYKLMEFVRSKGGYLSVTCDRYCKGDFQITDFARPGHLDMKDDVTTLSQPLADVFRKEVIQSLRDDDRTDWPELVLGNPMDGNMTFINYGRIDFSQPKLVLSKKRGDMITLSAMDQVRLYCHYIMRRQYCNAKTLFSSYRPWLAALAEQCGGRVLMVDMGCGPGTCGLAFSEVMGDAVPHFLYRGIDVSTAMRTMAERLMTPVVGKDANLKTLASFAELEGEWAKRSEVPHLVVFSFSYFFSNVDGRFSERLAQMIVSVMQRYPLNRYTFFIQQSDHDSRIASYRVFMKSLQPSVDCVKKGQSQFSYQLAGDNRSLPFHYAVLKGRE